MRNTVLGGICVLWGGGVLLGGFLRGGPTEGSYAAGQTIAKVFSLIMLVVGLYYFIAGIRSINREKRRAKPKKRKRRVLQDEED